MTSQNLPWTVGGLLAAPACHGAGGEILKCEVRPLAQPVRTPIVEDLHAGQIVFDGGSGLAARIQRLGARFRFDATHEITTVVDADDRNRAIEEAGRRFRRCAAALVVGSLRIRPPSAGLESAVLVVWTQAPGIPRENAIGSRHAFGVIPTSPPTPATAQVMGIIGQALGKRAEVGKWLEALYEADERAFLADEETDDRAVLDYCRVIEAVAAVVAHEHRKRDQFPGEQRAVYERIAVELRDELTKKLATTAGKPVSAKRIREATGLIRQAAGSVAQANLESAWHRVEHAATELAVPPEILEAARKAWKQRSRSAAHPGPSQEGSTKWEARSAAVVFIAHYAHRAVLGPSFTTGVGSD